MKRRFKLLAVAVGAVVLTLLLAVLSAPLVVDSAPVRARLLALVESHTGLEVAIDGAVHLTLLPRLRVIVTDVRVANPAGFASHDLARLGSLSLDPSLAALLGGRLEADDLEVDGAIVYLERDAAGAGNWYAAARAMEAAEPPSEQRARAAPVMLRSLNVRGARLVWRGAKGSPGAASIDVQTGAVDIEKSVDAVRVHASVPAGAGTVIIEARGDVSLPHADTAIVVPHLAVSVESTAAADVPVAAHIDGRLAIDMASRRLLMKDLRARVHTSDTDASIEGILRGDLDAGRYVLEAAHGEGAVGRARRAIRFRADRLVLEGARTLSGEALHASIGETQVDGHVELGADSALTRIDGAFALEVEGRPLTGSLAVGWAGPALDLALEVSADLGEHGGPFGLGGRNDVVVHAKVDGRTAAHAYRITDVRVAADLAAASAPDGRLQLVLETDLDVDPAREQVHARDVRLDVAGSRFAGSVDVTGFEKPALHFDLDADAVDAGRMLAAIGARLNTGGETTPVDAALETIRAMDVAGELRVARLTVEDMQLENVRLTATGGAKGR